MRQTLHLASNAPVVNKDPLTPEHKPRKAAYIDDFQETQRRIYALEHKNTELPKKVEKSEETGSKVKQETVRTKRTRGELLR